MLWVVKCYIKILSAANEKSHLFRITEAKEDMHSLGAVLHSNSAC